MFRAPSSARSGFTVLEILIVLTVFGLVAGFALSKFGEVKENAYIAAMKNDLRNFATAQEQYFHNQGEGYGLPDEVEAGEGFTYSANVHPDSSDATGARWFLRVRHDKTDVTCELDYRKGLDLQDLSNRIECPGDVEEATGSNNDPVADFTVFEATGSGDVAGPTLDGDDSGDGAAEVTADVQSTPDFTMPYGAELVFSGVATTDPDGDRIVSYQWTFGGTTRSQETAEGLAPRTHWTGVETVQVTLTVEDERGGTDEATKTIELVNEPPNASITLSTSTPADGQEVTLDGTNSTDPNDDITSYTWEVTESGSVLGTASGTSAAHTFSGTGGRTVRLVVQDAAGAVDTAETSVTMLGSVALQAWWDACSSIQQGGDSFVDIVGGHDLTLASDGSVTNWADQWSAEGRGGLDVEADKQVRATAPTSLTPSQRNLTFFVLLDPASTQAASNATLVHKNGGSYWPSYDWRWLFTSGSHSQEHRLWIDGSDWHEYYQLPLGASPAGSWTVLTLRAEYAGSGRVMPVDVFVNGTKLTDGTKEMYPPFFDGGGGGLTFFNNSTNPSANNGIDATVASMLLYQGLLSDAEVQQKTDELLEYRCGLDDLGADVKADFDWTPSPSTEGQTATFDGSLTEVASGRSISTYSWDFDGDGVEDATEEAPTHAFDMPGVHPVQLTVTDNEGAQDSVTYDVDVESNAGDIVAWWRPCESFGTETLVDAVGSHDVTLQSENNNVSDWVNVWASDNRAYLDLTGSTDQIRSIYRSYISDATDWTMFAVVRPPAGAYDYDPDVPTLGMLRHGSSWMQTAMSGDSVMLDGRAEGTFSGVQAETWQVLAVQADYEAGSGKQTAEVFLDGVSVGVDDSVSVEGGMGLTGGFDFFEHTNSTADSWFDGDVASIMLVEGDLTASEVASRSQQLLDFRCSLGGPLGDIRAAFEYSPDVPTAGEFVTFDASASETTEGQISSYTWDFGDGVTNTTTDTTTLHAYETAGTYSAQLIATAPSGAADTVIRDVEVGQADTDGPLAYWSPCASTGTSTLEDIVGGNDMPLFGSGDPSTEWGSGSKEYLVVERENGNDIRAEGNLPFDDTEFTFFALAREGSCGQTGGGSRCQLLSFEDDHGPDWSIGWGGGVLASGGWVTTGGVDFGDPGSGWHVITARFDTAPGGDHQLEMFVDGTQMGPTVTWTEAEAGGPITPEGFTRFFQRADRFDENAWGDFKFVGDVSAISYYGRAVSDSLIGAESSRMLSGSGCMGGAGQGPIADIEYEPEGPLVGDEVTFSGLGSSDPDGFLTGYAWDFDDGVTESGSVLGHTFSQAGTYTTQLTVTDNDGLTGVADTTLTVGELQGEMACTSSIESISNQDPERAFDIWTDDRDPDNLTVWATTWRTFDSPPWNATGAALVTGQSGAVSWEVYDGYPSGTGDPATMLDDDGKALRDSIAIRMPAPSGNDWTKNYTVSISGETGENTGEVQFRCSLNQISVNVSADADSYALGDPGRFAASASQAPGLSIDNFNVEATPPSGAGTTLCQKSGGAIFSCSGELPATEVGIWTLKATATGSGLEEATKTVTYEVTSN